MSEPLQIRWTGGSRARAFFQAAVFASIILTLALVTAGAALWTIGAENTTSYLGKWWLKPLWFLVGAIGAPLSLFLWLGMVWHCLTNSRTTPLRRAFWLVFLGFGNWLAAPIYYALVYQKDMADWRKASAPITE